MSRTAALSNTLNEPPAACSDDVLVARARRGEEAAFGELVRRYEPLVAATVVGMLGPGMEAEDVGQETFIRFYRALDHYRGDARLGTYLSRIAINLSLNALKRRQRWYRRFLSRDETPGDFAEPSVDERRAFDERLEAEFVHQAIQQLEPNFRAVVVLRLINGCSTKETAEQLGIPIGTVLSRLSRAQRKLHDLLGPYLRDDGSQRL